MIKILEWIYDGVDIIVKGALLVLRFLAISLWLFLTVKGIYLIYSLAVIDNYTFDQLLSHLLHTIEILFIAPIPMMIIESFRDLLSKILQDKKNKIPEVIDEIHLDKKAILWKKVTSTISSEDAERAFVSSLIGVTSTFLIGRLFELLSGFKTLAHFDPAMYNMAFITAPIFLFIIIQIYYLKSLRKDKGEK